jgi:hypothetical protein
MGVETALVVGSLAASGASAGISFAQAGKQKQLQKEAEMAAEKALAEARKKLDVNFYAGLGINKEPYNLQREASLASGAQLISAGAESERGVAGIAGQVQMAQNAAQSGIASDMGTEMARLDEIVAKEDSRLAGEQANLYLGEAEGAQLAARDAQQAGAAATTAGVGSILNLANNASTLAPLYPKSKTKPTTAVTNTVAAPTIKPIQSPGFFDPSTGFKANLGQNFNIAPSAFNIPSLGGTSGLSLGGNENTLFQEFLKWKQAQPTK